MCRQASTRLDQIWACMMDLYVSQDALDVQRRALESLLELSETQTRWAASPIGGVADVASASWPSIRSVWKQYLEYKCDASSYKKRAEMGVPAKIFSRNFKQNKRGIVIDRRPAIDLEAWHGSLSWYATTLDQYKKVGTLFAEEVLGMGAASSARERQQTNPLLAITARNGDLPALHYLAFPLDGFHKTDLLSAGDFRSEEDIVNAQAFPAALFTESSFAPVSDAASWRRSALRASLSELALWGVSFRRAALAGRVKISVIVGDVFETTDHLARAQQSENRSTSPDASFLSHELRCPFDAIDVSNLVDHYGGLNLVLACLPLLSGAPHARIFADVMKENSDATGRSGSAKCERLLLMTPTTAALLLGVELDPAKDPYATRCDFFQHKKREHYICKFQAD